MSCSITHPALLQHELDTSRRSVDILSYMNFPHPCRATGSSPAHTDFEEFEASYAVPADFGRGQQTRQQEILTAPSSHSKPVSYGSSSRATKGVSAPESSRYADTMVSKLQKRASSVDLFGIASDDMIYHKSPEGALDSPHDLSMRSDLPRAVQDDTVRLASGYHSASQYVLSDLPRIAKVTEIYLESGCHSASQYDEIGALEIGSPACHSTYDGSGQASRRKASDSSYFSPSSGTVDNDMMYLLAPGDHCTVARIFSCFIDLDSGSSFRGLQGHGIVYLDSGDLGCASPHETKEDKTRNYTWIPETLDTLLCTELAKEEDEEVSIVLLTNQLKPNALLYTEPKKIRRGSEHANHLNPGCLRGPRCHRIAYLDTGDLGCGAKEEEDKEVSIILPAYKPAQPCYAWIPETLDAEPKKKKTKNLVVSAEPWIRFSTRSQPKRNKTRNSRLVYTWIPETLDALLSPCSRRLRGLRRTGIVYLDSEDLRGTSRYGDQPRKKQRAVNFSCSQVSLSGNSPRTCEVIESYTSIPTTLDALPNMKTNSEESTRTWFFSMVLNAIESHAWISNTLDPLLYTETNLSRKPAHRVLLRRPQRNSNLNPDTEAHTPTNTYRGDTQRERESVCTPTRPDILDPTTTNLGEKIRKKESAVNFLLLAHYLHKLCLDAGDHTMTNPYERQRGLGSAHFTLVLLRSTRCNSNLCLDAGDHTTTNLYERHREKDKKCEQRIAHVEIDSTYSTSSTAYTCDLNSTNKTRKRRKGCSSFSLMQECAKIT
ncbi:uncharacterized protein MYCFIDRAFT_208490 [Pseudocercospora fijiensis CIRAD86]|uniref:Uncharacterized protein n=1 Tax=Pseudocercospora fijiensis (strain CIRAD86) TaxID=383855 RepID=M2ZM51_PSEFD|nr:uncharacterized protein MYCFIDRAFT_208490 [Pseudocercospora fijiensis CIRAD86]EME80144.1 hypothetical protein MYCFIDRAFT_208490 [Pseudocercospora fijiensis CIRAD86]